MSDYQAVFLVLEQMDKEHRGDRDGGSILEDSILQWVRTLDSESRRVVWTALIEMIKNRHRNLWGVAIEVLVSEQPVNIGEELSALLQLPSQDIVWKDTIIFALLRLGYKPFASSYISHIREGLDKGRTAVFPLLAALCLVDADACLGIASKYFSQRLKSEHLRDPESGHLPTFIRHFVAADKSLIWRLVQKTKSINVESGVELGQMFSECLRRPWYAREIPGSDLDIIQKQLQQEMRAEGQ